ncbi:hypothetical protein BV898_02709 [Hypsibius exemplaris]|uniref:Uncharacterized protein n=1 Tax=Hypsibius exemplaris TaxID=2072580 RepID=A0A1W0X7W2_HYPEX|nr:hypothetical protein BV898_02709 [Hypsibius exemplaris]
MTCTSSLAVVASRSSRIISNSSECFHQRIKFGNVFVGRRDGVMACVKAKLLAAKLVDASLEVLLLGEDIVETGLG